jgi:hypothetical protein
MPDKRQARPSAAEQAPAKSYYQIVHGAVGGWAQGQVISSDDLAGIDVDRLLRLGAIAPTQEPIKDVLPLSEEGDGSDAAQTDDVPPVA